MRKCEQSFWLHAGWRTFASPCLMMATIQFFDPAHPLDTGTRDAALPDQQLPDEARSLKPSHPSIGNLSAGLRDGYIQRIREIQKRSLPHIKGNVQGYNTPLMSLPHTAVCRVASIPKPPVIQKPPSRESSPRTRRGGMFQFREATTPATTGMVGSFRRAISAASEEQQRRAELVRTSSLDDAKEISEYQIEQLLVDIVRRSPAPTGCGSSAHWWHEGMSKPVDIVQRLNYASNSFQMPRGIAKPRTKHTNRIAHATFKHRPYTSCVPTVCILSLQHDG